MSMNHVPMPGDSAGATGSSEASAYAAPMGEATFVAPPWVAPVLVEDVPRGLLFSLAAVPVGVALSIVIWKAGYVASISSLVMAALAVWLYSRGARMLPRKGLAVVLGVIVLGVVASFFGIVGADLVEYYQANSGDIVVSEATFVLSNLTNGDVLVEYLTDGAMLAGFAALGVFGTIRRLLASSRTPATA